MTNNNDLIYKTMLYKKKRILIKTHMQKTLNLIMKRKYKLERRIITDR